MKKLEIRIEPKDLSEAKKRIQINEDALGKGSWQDNFYFSSAFNEQDGDEVELMETIKSDYITILKGLNFEIKEAGASLIWGRYATVKEFELKNGGYKM